MKNSWVFFVSILIVLLVMYVSWRVGYRDGTRHAVPAYDTILVCDTQWLPAPSPIQVVQSPVPTQIDSAAVVRDYYKQRIYDDTLIQTEFVSVRLRDTVYNNLLLGRTLDYKIKVPVPKYNNQIFVSADIGSHLQVISAGYQYKNLIYKAGYDFYNEGPVIGIGLTLKKW